MHGNKDKRAVMKYGIHSFIHSFIWHWHKLVARLVGGGWVCCLPFVFVCLYFRCHSLDCTLGISGRGEQQQQRSPSSPNVFTDLDGIKHSISIIIVERHFARQFHRSIYICAVVVVVVVVVVLIRYK